MLSLRRAVRGGAMTAPFLPPPEQTKVPETKCLHAFKAVGRRFGVWSAASGVARGGVHYFKSKSFGAPFSICGTESAPWGTLKLKVVFSGFAV